VPADPTTDATRTRGWRRAQRARVQRKRRGYWGRGRVSPFALPVTPDFLGRVAKTPRPCSAWCCGNPRRHFGTPTMQERRAALAALAAPGGHAEGSDA